MDSGKAAHHCENSVPGGVKGNGPGVFQSVGSKPVFWEWNEIEWNGRAMTEVCHILGD